MLFALFLSLSRSTHLQHDDTDESIFYLPDLSNVPPVIDGCWNPFISDQDCSSNGNFQPPNISEGLLNAQEQTRCDTPPSILPEQDRNTYFNTGNSSTDSQSKHNQSEFNTRLLEIDFDLQNAQEEHSQPPFSPSIYLNMNAIFGSNCPTDTHNEEQQFNSDSQYMTFGQLFDVSACKTQEEDLPGQPNHDTQDITSDIPDSVILNPQDQFNNPNQRQIQERITILEPLQTDQQNHECTKFTFDSNPASINQVDLETRKSERVRKNKNESSNEIFKDRSRIARRLRMLKPKRNQIKPQKATIDCSRPGDHKEMRCVQTISTLLNLKPDSKIDVSKKQELREESFDPASTQDKVESSKKLRFEDLPHTKIIIEKYTNLYGYMASYFKMIQEMTKQMKTFKSELKRMVDHCRVNEKRVKNRMLEYAFPKDSSNDSYTQHLNTAVELNDELIDLIANMIQEDDGPDVEIESISGFSPESLLLNYWNRAKGCVSILKEKYKTQQNGKQPADFNVKFLLFNDAFLKLLEDSIARLDFDLSLKHRVFNRSTDLRLSGSLNTYISQTMNVMEFLKRNINEKSDLVEKNVAKMEKNSMERYTCNFSKFSTFFRSLIKDGKKFQKMKLEIKECNVFTMMMFTRSRILCELYFTIVNMFCHPTAYTENPNSDLPLLVLYTFLDFRRVEEFRRMYYPC